MARRGIDENQVRQVLESGELIEEYPADLPFASRLVLGWIGGRPLHVVAADVPGSDRTVIITVYDPDPARWSPDFRQRRTR
jgi:hypothetical protein